MNTELTSLQNAANSVSHDLQVFKKLFDDKRKATRYFLNHKNNTLSPVLDYESMNVFILGIIRAKKLFQGNSTKHLLITSKELNEQNIGVITCDESGTFELEKLIQALQQHFDESIKVAGFIKSEDPLRYEIKCHSEEKQYFIVELNETWIY